MERTYEELSGTPNSVFGLLFQLDWISRPSTRWNFQVCDTNFIYIRLVLGILRQEKEVTSEDLESKRKFDPNQRSRREVVQVCFKWFVTSSACTSLPVSLRWKLGEWVDCWDCSKNSLHLDGRHWRSWRWREDNCWSISKRWNFRWSSSMSLLGARAWPAPGLLAILSYLFSLCFKV